MTVTAESLGLVWITRSEPGASRQAQDLRAAGYAVWVQPVLSVRACHPPPDASTVARLDIALVLSEHAVLHLSSSLQNALTQVPRVIAIGATTAAALAHCGIPAQQPATASSEGLLALLDASEPALTGKSVGILKGQGGRGVLEPALSRRGARVRPLDLYERYALGADEIRAPEDIANIGAIFAASGDGLSALHPWWQRWSGRADVPLLGSSDRVCALARGKGFLNAYNCAGADSTSVIATLRGLAGG